MSGHRNLPARTQPLYRGLKKGERHLKNRTEAEKFQFFWSRARIQSEFYCWEWTGNIARQTGYGRYQGRTAHRQAYALTFGEPPEELLVRHRCDNRICVNPNHLILGTVGDNNRDMFERKRCAYHGGKSNSPGRPNITVEDVKFIRSIYRPWKMTMRKISEQYGFPYFSVKCAVDRNDKWKDVPWPS